MQFFSFGYFNISACSCWFLQSHQLQALNGCLLVCLYNADCCYFWLCCAVDPECDQGALFWKLAWCSIPFVCLTSCLAQSAVSSLMQVFLHLVTKNCCSNCFNFPNLAKLKSRIDAMKTKFLFLLGSHTWKYWFCWLKVLISRVQPHNLSSEEAWSIRSSFIIHILLISTEMEGRPVLKLHHVTYIKSREIRKWENPERQEPEVNYSVPILWNTKTYYCIVLIHSCCTLWQNHCIGALWNGEKTKLHLYADSSFSPSSHFPWGRSVIV